MGIGTTIRHLRTSRNLSQGKVACQLGVTASYLSLIEHEKREPSLSLLRKVAKYFKIPVEFLLLHQTPLHELKPAQRRLLQQIRHNLLGYILFRDVDSPRPTPSS